MPYKHRRYAGRFAPSPTGPLHFGSLVCAVASYLQARSHRGTWRVRIENIDPPREPRGMARHIVQQLLAYGFHIDGHVLMQADHIGLYHQLINKWQVANLTYACECSRTTIRTHSANGPLGVIYPGICAPLHIDYQPSKHVLRLRYQSNQIIRFFDQTYGWQKLHGPQQDGDFIVFRRGQLPSYALACGIDDILEGYTEIVRGSDLLAQTFRQYRVAQACARILPLMRHVPVIVDKQGDKLSKQTHAQALPVKGYRLFLFEALQSLGQTPPRTLINRSLPAIWQWAISHWNPGKIPTRASIPYFMDQ